MSFNLMGFEASIYGYIPKPSIFSSSFLNFNGDLLLNPSKTSSNLTLPLKFDLRISTITKFNRPQKTKILVGNSATAEVEEEAEVEIHPGVTMTKFCDRLIEVFLVERPNTKDWRKLLIYRENWKKYKDSFYSRCKSRADSESDSKMKQKLIALARKVKRVDDEMEKHNELFKEVEGSPTDINAIVARRRKEFSGEFFQYLTLVKEAYSDLEDRDSIARLGARCLSAVSAYDNTLETVDTLDTAQAKFDDVLDSPSTEAACEKIESLAKAKKLDSSLILLINSAWAAAKESPTMKNEVKEIMYQLYKTTKSSLRNIAPKEIRLLKYLLNITDPEERFSALATSFSPGDDLQAKDPDAIYTNPKELHKWITIMLDAYHSNKEETDIREAQQMNEPMVIQRLFILKSTIEEEYLAKPKVEADKDTDVDVEEFF